METGALGMHGLPAHQNAHLLGKENVTTLFQNTVVRPAMDLHSRKVLVLLVAVSINFLSLKPSVFYCLGILYLCCVETVPSWKGKQDKRRLSILALSRNENT